jgi:hypothetical protein
VILYSNKVAQLGCFQCFGLYNAFAMWSKDSFFFWEASGAGHAGPKNISRFNIGNEKSNNRTRILGMRNDTRSNTGHVFSANSEQ